MAAHVSTRKVDVRVYFVLIAFCLVILVLTQFTSLGSIVTSSHSTKHAHAISKFVSTEISMLPNETEAGQHTLSLDIDKGSSTYCYPTYNLCVINSEHPSIPNCVLSP